MPRNIEIKARVHSMPELRQRASALADAGPTEIAQDDTFFHCDRGRLKLRAFSPDRGELIFYRRADASGPKESFYVLAPTADPDSLRDALTLAYGQSGRVIKQRTLFLVGRTRVHLDRVNDLGDFMELEVVLDDGESIDDGLAEATSLMEKLEIDTSHLVEGAYLDLLAGK
jgi:adenylate cyclase